MRETYLDWNATAPLRPEAAAAMRDAMARGGNPSSVHRWGRAARRMVEEAREAIAALVPGEVIFTSGGTEANHLALHGAGRPRVLVSAVEHSSVLQAVPGAERIPVDGDGVVVLGALARMLGDDALVSVMLANNETGAIQPLPEIVALAHGRGALVHCDAVQAAGKMPIDVGADLVTVSAHKIGGSSCRRRFAAADRSAGAAPGPRMSSASPALPRRPKRSRNMAGCAVCGTG